MFRPFLLLKAALRRQSRYLIRLTVVICLLTLTASCAQIRWWFPDRGDTVNLSLSVSASSIPGTYTIAGKAALPDQTEITIAAVRYLYPGNRASAQLNPDPTYSVLAYQTVEVAEGAWQTDLNLWEIAANGQFQEPWQQEQVRLKLSFKPDDQVIFLATLAPIDKLGQLERQLASQGVTLADGIVRTTAEGQRYAQVNQLMAIALPSGTTTPPTVLPLEADNFGWGKRYLIPFEPQNPTKLQLPKDRQTNAPSAPEEFLR